MSASPTTDRETSTSLSSGQERLARAVADAVLGVPGVDRLAAGDGVEVATLFPGGKVTGIRLGDPVEVHVVLGRLPVGPVAERIRVAVREVLAVAGEERTVVVTVEDLSPTALSPTAVSSAPGAHRAAG